MDGDRFSSLTDVSVSRRGAMALGGAALGSTFALSVQPVCAQTMITTSTDGLTAGVVKVKTKDGKEMDAYRAMPATGQGFGTIVVVPEIWGVHAHIADVCRRFAKAGYYAIASELYFRQGDPKVIPDTQALIRDIVAKVPDEQVMNDLDSSVAFVKSEGKGDSRRCAKLSRPAARPRRSRASTSIPTRRTPSTPTIVRASARTRRRMPGRRRWPGSRRTA